MFGALLVCAAAVLAAAAPGVALAAGDLSAAQDRVAATGLATRAAVLAHTLADERDGLAVSAAAARAAGHGPGLSDADRARADRQVQEVVPGAPADLRTVLAGLDSVRRQALTGTGGPPHVVAAYQPLIDALGRVTGPVTAPLGRAVDAAAVQRGDLVAALTAGGAQRDLVAAAQAARVQERAALAEFRAVAPEALRGRYDETVTGADTAKAERDLAKLLGGPELTGSDRNLGATTVQSALTARIALMRSVEASAATDEAQSAGSQRDHRISVLELRVALAVLCLILLLGVLVSLFRGLTRPLAALYRWSRADPANGEGAEVIGADEFAVVARRVNALTHEAHALRTRVREVTAERTAAASMGTALAAERETLIRARSDLQHSRDEIAGQLTAAAARNALQITYVNLSLRTLGLVERQLALIDSLEDREQDPDRLDTLFKLDHLATRMRRNSENLLVLTGTEHSHGATARPIPLIDVARAAVSEIERYERVRVRALPEAQVAGRAADDIGHLVAELLDNATGFSGPEAEVLVSGWLMESGEVMLSIEDSGIGVPSERLDALNELLADPDPAPPGAVSGMGLYVVARLAHRHGVRVQLRPQAGGGTTAVVVLPRLLLPSAGPEDPSTPLDLAALAAFPGPRTEQPAHTGPFTALNDALADPLADPLAGSFADPLTDSLAPSLDDPLAGSFTDPLAGSFGEPFTEPYPPVAAPDQHERAEPGPSPDDRREPAPGPAPLAALPQRVPRPAGPAADGVSAPDAVPAGAGDPAVPAGSRHRRRDPVDAEALRRTLGGLQRGLEAGRREAEREITTGTGPLTAARTGRAERAPGTPATTGEAITADTEEATRP